MNVDEINKSHANEAHENEYNIRWQEDSHEAVAQSPPPEPVGDAPEHDKDSEGGTNDAVGSPHRAQISQVELFELKSLNSSFVSLVSYWNWANGSLSSNSRQLYLSQPYPAPPPLRTARTRRRATPARRASSRPRAPAPCTRPASATPRTASSRSANKQ